MAFDLVRAGSRLPTPVARRLTRIEHEALITAQKVNAVGFVHSVATITAANMVRTTRSLAGGDADVQMVLDGLTGVAVASLESIQARLAMSL